MDSFWGSLQRSQGSGNASTCRTRHRNNTNDDDVSELEHDGAPFNPLQHLSGLPMRSRPLLGRQARRQVSRGRSRSRSRSPKREPTDLAVSTITSSRGSTIPTAPDLPEASAPTRSSPSYSSDTELSNIGNLPHGCTCPTGPRCRNRESEGLLDCRPLVIPGSTWQERGNEEAYDEYIQQPAESNAEIATEDTIRQGITAIDRFEQSSPNSRDTINNISKRIKGWIDVMKVCDVTAQALENTGLVGKLEHFLKDENRDVRSQRRFQPALEDDLTFLLRKWKRGDLSCCTRRGLSAVVTQDQSGLNSRVTYRLNKDWEHYISANFYGERHLVNGQTSSSRVELMRDGVHSAPVAGICGTVSGGARSIVVGYHDEKNDSYYADIDMGEILDYIGTALKDVDDQGDGPTNVPDTNMQRGVFDGSRKPTACTQMLMTSYKTGNDVRVIRSHMLAPQVPNRPVKGYRYDGLYRVVRMTPLKEDRQIWSFRLVRIPGQSPLRGFGRHEPTPSAHGKRVGYKRYNTNKYGPIYENSPSRRLDRARSQRSRRNSH